MPTYPHLCSNCSSPFDIVCTIADRNEPWRCPKCDGLGERQLTRANFNGAADWNNQTWSPALGCYTKSDAEARKIAKSKGFEEIGTEKPETIEKHFEKQRADTYERRWNDDRDLVYD